MEILSDLSVSATTIIPQNYIIYKTTNLINKMFYIGQHLQLTSGFDGYLGSGIRLNNAIRKYGRENFIRETIEYCTSANKNEREVYWIAKLDAMNKKIGYNLTEGGEGCVGYKMSEEQRQFIIKMKTGTKLSEEHRQAIIKANTGSIKTEETKRKISESHKGKKFTDEHRKNISESKKGRSIGKGKIISEDQRKKISDTLKIFFSNPLERQKLREINLGKKHTQESIQKMREVHKNDKPSEETKRKISESHKGKKFTDEHRKNISKARKGSKASEETKRKLREARQRYLMNKRLANNIIPKT